MSKYIKVDGSSPWKSNQSMGFNRLTSIAEAIDDNDAINLKQLDDGFFGSSTTGSPQIISSTVPASSTGTIATSRFSQTRAIRYMICVKSQDALKYSPSELLIIRKSSSYDITESVIIGDELDYEINATDDGIDISLIFLNHETTSLDIDLIIFAFG